MTLNPLHSKGNYSGISNNRKLVHWPLMGGLLHLVQRWGVCMAGCHPGVPSVDIFGNGLSPGELFPGRVISGCPGWVTCLRQGRLVGRRYVFYLSLRSSVTKLVNAIFWKHVNRFCHDPVDLRCKAGRWDFLGCASLETGCRRDHGCSSHSAS